MATRAKPRPIGDTYFKLVREFPLVPIRDDEHLEQAIAVINRLLTQERDDDEEAYLNVLTDLVEAYEDEHVPIGDASEADVLRELMRANGLSQSALAKRVGIQQSTISAVLSGKRSLTRDHITKLADYFQVEPTAFLPAKASRAG